MGMVMGLITLSEANIRRIVKDPPLVWQVVARDEPDIYLEARAEAGDGNSSNVPDLVFGEFEGIDAYLDKSWHGIHYLLTGTAWEGSFPESFLLSGGQPAGEIEVGYGPARLLSAAEVAQIHRALSDLSDDALRARFDPVDMTKLQIYPEMWDRADEADVAIGYLMEYLAAVREQVRTAAQRGLGLLVYMS